MIVIDKNVGPKIPYEVIGTKIIFDDDLMLNLAKRQDDEPVHIVISRNKARALQIGTADLWRYVAEIDIPACGTRIRRGSSGTLTAGYEQRDAHAVGD